MIEILLDEHLDCADLEDAIRKRWRRVQNIKRIRPQIKDPDIPRQVLQRRRGCIFVTLNHSDFWRKVPGNPKYAIVCLSIPANRSRWIPVLLQWLFRLPPFQTDAGRRGKVFKITRDTYEYYSSLSDESSPEPWPGLAKRRKQLK